MYMRAFADTWPEPEFVQQPVGQIPWGHNLVLLAKLKNRDARLAYARCARLPKPQSDLARETLKDSYRFDFLGISDDASELQLEGALVQHITRFLLELGAEFAYVGRQVHLEIGGDDFYIDLLFYHLKLHAYIVIELKATSSSRNTSASSASTSNLLMRR